MKKKFILGLLIIGISIMLSSCATVITGTSQKISVYSNVPGAEVYVNGFYVGKTPCNVLIKKSNSIKTIKIKKDGYQDAVATIGASYNTIALLDVFWDYSTTDLLTGAAWTYEPDSVYVNLLRSSYSFRQ